VEARTYQSLAEAEAWLMEMLAHNDNSKWDKTLNEMDDLLSDDELDMAA